MVEAGVWLQVTAGSLAGTFGAAYTLLGGASAGQFHGAYPGERCARPLAAAARACRDGFELARKIVGEDEAMNLVLTRPLNILDDEPVEASPQVSVTVEESWNPVADLRDLLKRAV